MKGMSMKKLFSENKWLKRLILQGLATVALLVQSAAAVDLSYYLPEYKNYTQ